MIKKLTNRQKQFLEQFLALYHEMLKPLHYGFVADRLGIGKVTAYEMLRLLEDKGLVSAEYQSNPGQHGPGRPAIHFFPTEAANQLVTNVVGKSFNVDDWSKIKEKILSQLKEETASGYEDLIASLLERVPDQRNPLAFLTELLTSVIVLLNSNKFLLH